VALEPSVQRPGVIVLAVAPQDEAGRLAVRFFRGRCRRHRECQKQQRRGDKAPHTAGRCVGHCRAPDHRKRAGLVRTFPPRPAAPNHPLRSCAAFPRRGGGAQNFIDLPPTGTTACVETPPPLVAGRAVYLATTSTSGWIGAAPTIGGTSRTT